MARTTLASNTATRLVETGTDPTAVDVAANLIDGDAFPHAHGRLLYVANGDSTTLTCTFPTPGTAGPSLAIADASGTVAAGAWKLFGPFDDVFVQSTGLVHVDYSGADASVTVALLDAE